MTIRRQITLPEELCTAAEQRFTPAFNNLESLLEFVLRELTRRDAESLNEAEEAMLEERLRNLGYL